METENLSPVSLQMRATVNQTHSGTFTHNILLLAHVSFLLGPVLRTHQCRLDEPTFKTF